MQDKKIIPISVYNSGWSKKFNKRVPGVVALDFDFYTFAYNVKSGVYKNLIDPLKEITNAKEKSSYKTEKLLSVTISSLCRTPRSEKNIIQHSGLLCIDIDPGNNPEIKNWAFCRDDQADRIPCLMSSLSCSLNGVFIVVRIDPKKHVETFEYLEFLFKKQGIVIDPAPKNPISLRFVSYDPDCYINDDFDNTPIITPTAEFWEYKKLQDEKLFIARINAKPVTTANDRTLFENAVAEAEIKGYVLERGTGTRLIQYIVGYCNLRGMDKQVCIDFFIQHYGTTDYYTAEAIADRITDMFERYEYQHATIPVNTGASLEISFFDVVKDNKGRVKTALNRGRFLDFFHAAGVGLLMINKAAVLIKLTGATFEKVTTEQLRKLVLDHINTLPESFDCGITRLDLQEVILKGSDSYFSKSFLEFIKHFSPDYLQDTKEMAYIPFRNGVVCVSTARVELKTYEQLGKHIWKDHVIDFDIQLDQSRACESVWFKLLCCICGNDNLPTFTSEQNEKLLYLESIAGYLGHKYKDPSRPYAIILAEETQSDDKGGGTGKGLFMKGQSYISPTCIIPGKKFNPADRFAWQRVELHHKIVAIDDTAKNFIFESLNNATTDGLTIEGKNEQEIMLSYEDSPKIVVISNYVIPNSSNHAKRRQRVFEFSPFFSPGYTPERHFGHILFQDWDRDEWNRFYNFQIFCIRQYLSSGLPDRAKSGILKRREVSQRYGIEVANWYFEEYFPNGCEEWQSVNDLYNDFLSYSSMVEPDYSMKKFRTAITSATQSIGHSIPSERRSIPSKDGEKEKKISFVRVVKSNSGRDSD